MSSVLKALRDQSSPLLQQPAPIWLSSAQTSKSLRWWWFAALALVVLALSSFYSWYSSNSPVLIAAQTNTEALVPVLRYELGPPTEIKVPVWNTAQSETSVTRVVERPREEPQGQLTEPRQQPLDVQQGIDLQQVSPDLLAAFEEAVAAQQGRQPVSSQQTSVLPAISTLTVDLQRQIPSFSYDAHQYSSRDSARNVTFSGQRLVEGEVWQGMTIMRITPTHVVLSRNQVAFQQPALEDWTRP
jgi:hypothetical protein